MNNNRAQHAASADLAFGIESSSAISAAKEKVY
jgi:hypothetical protein